MRQLGLAPGVLNVHRHKIRSWEVNHKNSCVAFTIEQLNLVAKPFRSVTGKFQVYTGAIQPVASDFNEAKIDFSVIVGSIQTGNNRRDKHLRSSDFLDAQQFPVIQFSSVAFIKLPGDRYVLEGDLRLRDVSRRVVFDVTQQPFEHERNGQAARFHVSGKINRLDFGIKGNALSEIFIGKEVTITLQLEFLKVEI